MSSKSLAQKTNRLATYMAVVILVVFLLLPFHALLTTWAASNFGYVDQFKVWKEAIILLLSLGCVVLLIIDKPLRQQFFKSKLAGLIALYILLGLLRTIYGYSQGALGLEAIAFGVIGEWRYLAFFLVVGLVTARSNLLQRLWPFAVIAPATVVVLFGLLQQFVLDKNFLAHFGYGPGTIPPYQSVDQKTGFARIQSTLRGPNPLGAYLTMIVTFVTGLFYRFKSYRFSFGFLGVASIILMFYTYSRSAWVGLVISLATWSILVIQNKKVLKLTMIAGVVGLICLAAAVYSLRHNNYVQNVFFHTDETSMSGTSTNFLRTQAITDGLKDVIDYPLGQGLGSAGPPSARSTAPNIAENYYIQVAQETGIIGLLIYLAITVGVAYRLFERRDQLLCQVLFASLIGLSAINLVSHAWMDDTISLMWWGLAAIALTPVIINTSHERQTKSEKKS